MPKTPPQVFIYPFVPIRRQTCEVIISHSHISVNTLSRIFFKNKIFIREKGESWKAVVGGGLRETVQVGSGGAWTDLASCLA